MNSLFKPYLPLDEEGYVTITDSNDILNKEYELSPLIRSLKKAEMNLDMRQEEEEEIIVLTDDENDRDDNDDESVSYRGGSNASYSHGEESDDCDWYFASISMDSENGQSIIETVSVDSPSAMRSQEKLSSLSSLDSNDSNNSSATVENQPQNEPVAVHIEATPSTSKNQTNELSGENNRNLPTLDESMFNRLVNDINSSHLSVPSNGNVSSDSKMSENGESKTIKHSESSGENDLVNGIVSHPDQGLSTEIISINGNSNLSSIKFTDLGLESDINSIVSNNHIDVKSLKQSEPMKSCDIKVRSSGSLLQNHEETLENIEEIVTHDLRNHITSPKECSSTENNVDVEMESMKNNENELDIVQEITPQDFVPAAESTASVIADTSLLSKSEQDVLFKDRDAALIITDLCNNGAAEHSTKGDVDKKSTHGTNDSPSPIAFLQNGIDPSLRMKTYARRTRTKYIETKTISTQTSNGPSPITTIDESDYRLKDKHLLTEKENDELFLRDCFNPNEIPPRSNASPRIKSPMFLPSTPKACSISQAVASTPNASSIASNLTQSLQTTMECSAMSISGSGDTTVKRKRGRPRKYPLPEPGITPVKVVKPRQPRQPRKPQTPKDPNESGEVEVFERMKLRERKPKVVPPPPPPPSELPKKKTPRGRSRSPKKAVKEMQIKKAAKATKSAEKNKERDRARRRNTIKMTIDAILNTQSPNFSAIQARRISQILGITTPQLATILKRRNYNKSINVNQSMNNESELSESGSMLQTFKNRSNGQMNSTEPITSQYNSTSTPSTILARKTYIKPNITLSTLSSFSLSTLRRMSRRISFGTRRISFSSSVPRHPVRVTNTRKSRTTKQQTQQRYAAIDIFDTSTKSKRGRKKGSKDTVPRKRSTPKQKANQLKQIASKITPDKINPVVDLGPKIDESIELVDLTKEIAPFELDATCEMDEQFENIDTGLSSTQHFYNDSDVVPKKRNFFRSDDTETDVTNEFTTDPEESAVEDIDDSRTRKSKRSRKRPKILDL